MSDIIKLNKKKILKLIGFTLHGNINHYSDGEKAISDFKEWLKNYPAIIDLTSGHNFKTFTTSVNIDLST